MKKVGVAILGLGVVGGGTFKILTEKKEFFKKTQRLDVTVESVLERDKERAIKAGASEDIIAGNIEEVVSNPNVDIVVEVMGGVEPAKTFVLKALKSGKSVVTSNKELFAKCRHELEAEARKNGAGLYFEATCVGGVPIIRTLIDGMQANEIASIKGIINGTTNYVLTKMTKEGLSYEAALKNAQDLGFAERNPAADVEGFDATYKLSILASLAFHSDISIGQVYREGITAVTAEDIAAGAEAGYVLKLLAIGKKSEAGVEVRVHPAFISVNSGLAGISDSFNAVLLNGDSVGEIMLTGRGAGALPTGSAIVSDVIYAAKHSEDFRAPLFSDEKTEKETPVVSDFISARFVRLTASSSASVGKIVSAMEKSGVSVKSIKEKAQSGGVEVTVITAPAKESAFKKAEDKITSSCGDVKIVSAIRVEE